MTPPHASRAFTLIELLVVMGIVAILALIAAPSYMDQYIRNQILESVPLADIAKAPVATSWLLVQGFPQDNAAAGLPVPGKIVNNHIRSVTVEDGAIQIEFGHSVNSTVRGNILSLRPAVVVDAPVVPVTWVCGYAAGPPPMTVVGVNRTNVPERFLPLNCRKR
jgi:type IV pilus assembly protein PilA